MTGEAMGCEGLKFEFSSGVKCVDDIHRMRQTQSWRQRFGHTRRADHGPDQHGLGLPGTDLAPVYDGALHKYRREFLFRMHITTNPFFQ